MTYDELSAAISATMENTFPATDTAAGGTFTSKNQIDLFIRQAEQRLYTQVQFPSMRKQTTLALTPGNQYLSLPTDFLASYELAVVLASGAYAYLLNKDVSFIREAYPNPSTQGTPKHYAVFGADTPASPTELKLILGPTPDAAYSADLHYAAYPTSIVDSVSGTTWLGDNLDSALLAACVLEAALFMKVEQDLAQAYATRYQEALNLAKRLGDGMLRQDTYRNGQARVQVT